VYPGQNTPGTPEQVVAADIKKIGRFERLASARPVAQVVYHATPDCPMAKGFVAGTPALRMLEFPLLRDGFSRRFCCWFRRCRLPPLSSEDWASQVDPAININPIAHIIVVFNMVRRFR